jgi:hypothetical protein
MQIFWDHFPTSPPRGRPPGFNANKTNTRRKKRPPGAVQVLATTYKKPHPARPASREEKKHARLQRPPGFNARAVGVRRAVRLQRERQGSRVRRSCRIVRRSSRSWSTSLRRQISPTSTTTRSVRPRYGGTRRRSCARGGAAGEAVAAIPRARKRRTCETEARAARSSPRSPRPAPPREGPIVAGCQHAVAPQQRAIMSA